MKKVALITGSGRGIGLSIAKTLGLNGYKVILSDIFPITEAAELLNDLTQECIDADYMKCDISKASDREAVLKEIDEKYQRLDVLVNNAGVAPLVRNDILETTEDSFDRLININLKGTFFMCQIFANYMIKNRENELENYNPRIINIASVSSYTSSPNRGEYCISKAGISMTTMLFADKLAEFSIPVFEVRPGIILTDMTQGVKEKYEKLISDGITPIKRFGLPQDVANTVLAATTGLLDFSAGQVLNADGGFELRRL